MRNDAFPPGAIAATLLILAAPAAVAQNAPAGESTLPELRVRAAADQAEGAYTVRRSRGATGLELSLRETPQSVSVITRSQM